MCGLAGIAGSNSDDAIITRMIEIIKHRGPDARGFYRNEGICLGHCRLSINDLSENANQPFVTDDGQVAVIVNGEIYNFKELKQPLRKGGYAFKSDSDAEVVLHGYLDTGKAFFSKLNGMFAVVLWDQRKKELLLVRDRLGIKPLYYSRISDALVFASEIKALVQHENVELSLDFQSFIEYLAWGNYFSNRTLNSKIKMVEPGEMVVYRPFESKWSREYYWQPDFTLTPEIGQKDIYGQYRRIVQASVERHLLSDVPLGAYLSSGFDSSSVVCCASAGSEGELKTYTGYFGLSGYYDESEDAARVSKFFNCPHQRVEIGPQDFIDHIEKVCWHLDEPKVGMGSFSQYMVAKRASEDVKVILTGHGGDEFFAGYPVFRAIYSGHRLLPLIFQTHFRELIQIFYFKLLPWIRKEARFFLPNIFHLKGMHNLFDGAFDLPVKPAEALFTEPEKLRASCANDYERLTLTYLKYFLPALFVVEDKISMAFSLESRTPLCDNEMMDFALAIPLSDKLINHELKHIPKTAMKGRLPAFLYRLPKKGFPTPLAYWFKNELKSYIRDFILDQCHYIDMFNAKIVKKRITQFQKRKMTTPLDDITAYQIWVLLNLIIYFKHQRKRYLV
jgi:asparagine synthase (glutamine-hydrolysing)